MEVISLHVILVLFFGGFAAAFIDSTVGGGGLISVPVLMSLGLPPHIVLGTNKLAASMGAISSVFSFWRAGKINLKNIRFLIALSFIASVLGAFAVTLIDETFMKPLVVFLLVAIALYTFLKKDLGKIAMEKKTGILYAFLAPFFAFSIGFYDGFFGPGTGSFLIFAFLFLGYNFIEAAGSAKALNLASGIGALISFTLSDNVLWLYGLIMGFSMILGAFLGSRTAIKKGISYIKPLFLIITCALIIKQILSLF